MNCFVCKSDDLTQEPSGRFRCNKCDQPFHIFETDPSTLNEIQNCALKFNFTSIKQLEPIGERGAGFGRGNIVHAAFRAYYHLTIRGGMPWDMRFRKAVNYGEMKAAEEIGLEVEDVANVLKSIREYFTFYRDDTWVPLEVEKTFRKLIFEDADLKLILSGKIDLKVDTGPRNNHVILPVDHKSGIDIAPSELSNQFMAYSLVEKSNLFCVNKVGFQKGRKDEPAPPEKKFKRHIIPYTQPLLEHWLANSVWWVKYGIYCMEEGSFPQNFTSCDKYSGCQFKSVCYSDPSNMEYKLKSMFKVREKAWDPATSDCSPEELDATLEQL